MRSATVAFHTVTVNGLVTPEGSSTICVVSLLVITSIATMKMSATIATPTKVHSSRLSHISACAPVFVVPRMSRPSAHVAPPSPSSNSHQCAHS